MGGYPPRGYLVGSHPRACSQHLLPKYMLWAGFHLCPALETSGSFCYKLHPGPAKACPYTSHHKVTSSLAIIYPTAGSMQECPGSAPRACPLPAHASVLSFISSARVQPSPLPPFVRIRCGLRPSSLAFPPWHFLPPPGLQSSDFLLADCHLLSQKTEPPGSLSLLLNCLQAFQSLVFSRYFLF